MLIDFENAANGNDIIFQEDIRMVGRLIDFFDSRKSSLKVSGFRNTLVSDTPPDASGALKLLADLSKVIRSAFACCTSTV